jgi:hypothetical protein
VFRSWRRSPCLDTLSHTHPHTHCAETAHNSSPISLSLPYHLTLTMPSSARYQKGKVCTSQQQIVTYICLCPKQTVLPVIPLLNGLKGDQNQAIRQHERTAVHQDWLKVSVWLGSAAIRALGRTRR